MILLTDQDVARLPSEYVIKIEWELSDDVYGVLWVVEENVGRGTRRLMQGDRFGVPGDFYEKLDTDDTPSKYGKSLTLFAIGNKRQAQIVYRWQVHALNANNRPIVALKRLVITNGAMAETASRGSNFQL